MPDVARGYCKTARCGDRSDVRVRRSGWFTDLLAVRGDLGQALGGLYVELQRPVLKYFQYLFDLGGQVVLPLPIGHSQDSEADLGVADGAHEEGLGCLRVQPGKNLRGRSGF